MNNIERCARTIAGLYNNAKPQGLGKLHFTPEKMTPNEACIHAVMAEVEGQVNFDYLRGRVMKIIVKPDGSIGSTFGYDRDNGEGAALAAVTDGLKDSYYN